MFDARAAGRIVESMSSREAHGLPLSLDVRSASGEDTSEAYLSLYGQILIDAMRREVPKPGLSYGLQQHAAEPVTGEVRLSVSGAVTWRYTVRADGGVTLLGCEPVLDKLVIPPAIEGMPVTRIGKRAFFGCSELVELELPDTLSSIGDEAFRGVRLKAFEVPAGLVELGRDSLLPDCIDSFAAPTIRRMTVHPKNESFFMNGVLLCQRGPDARHSRSVLYAGRGGAYRIPDDVTEVGSMTFAGQRSISELIVHDHIEAVEQCGMYFAANLTRVTLEGAGPDGSDVQLVFPDSSTGIMSLRVGFNSKTVDARLLSEVADGAIYNSKSRFERYLLMCRRLANPLWLSPKRREAFIAELTLHVGEACAALAGAGQGGMFDLLFELGILNEGNFDAALEKLAAGEEAGAVNQLLASSQRYRRASAFDFDL